METFWETLPSDLSVVPSTIMQLFKNRDLTLSDTLSVDDVCRLLLVPVII